MKLDPSERRLVDQILGVLALPEPDRSLLVERWGLDDTKPRTLNELEAKFNLSAVDCRIRLLRAEKSFFGVLKEKSPPLLKKFFPEPHGNPRLLVVRFKTDDDATRR